MLAYLVIREGSKWSDVFRLVPGQSVTIGRAPTNQIVIKDERCSRNHAEVFLSDGQWTLRDLDSRNGTIVGEQLRPRRLRARRPATSSASATRNWSSSTTCPRPFPSPAPVLGGRRQRTATTTSDGPPRDRRFERAVGCTSRRRSRIAAGRRSSSRRRRSRRDGAARRSAAPRPSSAGWPSSWPRRPTSATMADLALAGLFEGTQIDAGALLAAAAQLRRASRTRDDLEVVASRTASALPYHRVSHVPGLDRAARGRGRAGPQRDGRQHAGQPRQQGRDPRHQRDLRPDPPRQAGASA